MVVAAKMMTHLQANLFKDTLHVITTEFLRESKLTFKRIPLRILGRISSKSLDRSSSIPGGIFAWNSFKSCQKPERTILKRSWVESTKFMKHKCEFFLIGTWQRSEENPERILLFILSRVFWTKLYRILKQILFIQWTTLKPESNQICSRILIHSLKVLEESGSWLILARFHQDWSGMRLGLFRCLASVCQCPPYSACLITLGRCFTAASNRRICLFSLLSKQVDEASVSSFLMFVNSFSLISFNGLISFTRSNFVKISVGRYAQ